MSVVCEKIQDGTHFSPHQSKQLPTGEFPYVTAKNVRPSGLDLSDITYLAEEDHRKIYERCDPEQGDVLLVKDGVNAGDAAINTFDGEISLLSSVSMLRPHEGLLTAGFLRYYLLSPQGYRSLTGQLTGTAIKRIILRKIREMPAPVAPLQEQHRIVAKIDELLSDLDAGVAALERAKANLKRYRAAVLKAAVEGQLTEAWRAEHPNTEPASKLLERILAERRQKWEADQLAKFAAADKEPPKNWKEKYVEPTPPDTTGLPELPQGWCWSSIGQCFTVAVGATPSRARPEYWDGEIPWVSSGQVQFCRINEPAEWITDLGLQNSNTKLNPPGSVLIGMIGEGRTRGQVAILDIEACNNQNCAAIWVSETPIPTLYVYFWLSSQYETTRRRGSGNNQPALNKQRVEAITVPLPPLEEQRFIVAVVEERLSQIDAAAMEIDHDLRRAARLRQSILKQAFEGKLVPQDPSDEPATALLERLRAKQAIHEGHGKRPRSAVPRRSPSGGNKP
jgi:type I restriction enzyme S subunit